MTELEKIEIILMAHKYSFSMYLKYMKLADNCNESNPRHKQYLERAKQYAMKSKELDYKIFIHSSPISSGNITLEAHALNRWREFIRSEKEYRERLLTEALEGFKGKDVLTSKKINGLVHNSVIRQATIEAMFTQIENEYGL